MKVNELIVNQYEDSDFLTYNHIKYKTICIVLDFFALCKGLNGMTAIERNVIEKKIFASIKPTKVNIQIVSNSLVAMELMGYVAEVREDIVIQQAGIEAYKRQTIHQIAASLTEAKRVRELSKWTIRISVVAFIISFLTLLVTIIK